MISQTPGFSILDYNWQVVLEKDLFISNNFKCDYD